LILDKKVAEWEAQQAYEQL